MSNVPLYENIYTGGLELNRNNEIRKTLNILRPLDVHFVEPLARIFTERVAIPFIRNTYAYSGIIAVKIASRFNNERAKRIEEGWYDPVSTEFLLRSLDKIQRISFWMARREPTWIPIVEYPDTCMVVAARHVYVVSTDMKDILSMPGYLREYMNQVCAAAQQEAVEETPPIEVIPEKPKSYWDRVKNICYDAFQGGKNYISAKAIQISTNVANFTKESIRVKAHTIIDENDKKMRISLVTNIVNAIGRKSIELSTRWLIRCGIGGAFYIVTKQAIYMLIPHKNEETIELAEKMARTTSFFLMLTGAFFWVRCLTPTIKRLYRAKEIKFDPEMSTLKEVAKTLNNQSRVKLVSEVYQFVSANDPNKSKIAHFIERISALNLDNLT